MNIILELILFLKDDEVPAPVHPDILIAKLNPGQVGDVE